MRLAPAFAAAIALSGCQSAMQAPEEAARATAQVKPTQGNKAIGEVSFEQTGGGVHVIAIMNRLAPGPHGFRIHEKGNCSAPDATSAGGPYHAGDLPMLVADKKGKAKLDVTLKGVTVSPGPNSIVGRAVVVHGDSGGRVACGVIQPG